MLSTSARDRPNLWLGVERLAGERLKRGALLERVAQSPGPGLVYAATPRHGEDLTVALAQLGVRVGLHHPGLKRDDRAALRAALVDRRIDVIVCVGGSSSELCGTGIRFVYHYDLSESLGAYYAEIEQAGDDGASASAILFYSPEDVGIRRFLAESGRLDREDIERVAQAISEADEPLRPKQLRARTGLSQAKVLRAVARLEEASLAETLSSGEVVALDSSPNLTEVVEVATRSHEQRREADQGRVEPLRAYAELMTCRRAYLMAYLGESYEPPCNNCDVCTAPAGFDRARRESAARSVDRTDPFPIDSQVLHKVWGVGVVTAYEGDGRGTVVVRFEHHGPRRLSLEVVRREGLLQPAD